MTSTDGSVVHVAIFSVSGEDSGVPCDEGKLLELVDRCRKNIPGLVELFVGSHEAALLPTTGTPSTASPKAKAIAMVSRHISAEALETFLNHPDYVAVANHLAMSAISSPVKSAFHSMSKL
mmetsp:Transcript_5854/g.6316  ORF Transcript_5854/g.6316 Transcript_5854/m.6316 type:complete len:121 (+) Transcript_5854:76-438(+)